MICHTLSQFLIKSHYLIKNWDEKRKIIKLVIFKKYLKIVIFYTEILTGKVVLWCFFTSEMSEKIHKSTFEGKISV